MTSMGPFEIPPRRLGWTRRADIILIVQGYLSKRKITNALLKTTGRQFNLTLPSSIMCTVATPTRLQEILNSRSLITVLHKDVSNELIMTHHMSMIKQS